MGIAQNLINIGRPVAFHPAIKKVAKTTNATLLLCQLLYWSDKTDSGIIKDSNDIRNETGLSVQEQRTARRILVENDLIEEKHLRLTHNIEFKVKMDVLNKRWEEVQDMSIEEALRYTPQEEAACEIEEGSIKETAKTSGQTIRNPFTHEIEIIDKPFTRQDEYQKPATKKDRAGKQKIKEEITEILGINPIGTKWEQFIDFALNRQVNHGEPARKFLVWAKNNKDFNPIYWTPQKMMILYPQAFISEKQLTGAAFDESFTPIEKPIVEKEYTPMPDYFKVKHNLD
ncbi:MAG: hypothetical protein GXY86_08710 [Firmicutes bacterium]|nr:hypothetical protein [Bacillota bacterium]